MTRLRALLVGTGGWASAHAEAYVGCRKVKLVAVCGHRDTGRLADLASRYGPVATGLDLQRLLEETQPDILDVACNPHYRVEPVRLAVESPSVKLVNIEKPMALTPGEAETIARLCRQSGKLLTVNHQKKFLPAWARLKRMIDDGVLGKVFFYRATCRGNLLEQGTHLIDMLLHYNGYAPIQWIMGQVADLEGLDKPQASAPDSAVASICFAGGVRALLEAGNVGWTIPGETNKWYQFAIQVFGAAGRAEVTLNKTLKVVRCVSGEIVEEPSSWDRDYIAALTRHLDSLADYIAAPEKGHISDLDKSMMSFNAVMGIYASACYGGRVEFPCTFEDRLLDDLRARKHSGAFFGRVNGDNET